MTDPLSLLRALLRTHGTVLADLDATPGAPQRMLVRHDESGTMQLAELSGEQRTALTALPEPVGSAHYIPGGRWAIVSLDAGGNERAQLYGVQLDEAARTPVTDIAQLRELVVDPRFSHRFAGVSRDGRRLAFLSNRGDGVAFDLWLHDLRTGETTLRHAAGAWLQPASGFSPDGRWVSVLRPGARPLDDDLLLVDTDTGEIREPLPHPGAAALVGAPAWITATRLLVSSNVDTDLSAIVELDLETGETRRVPGTGERHDCSVIASADGAVALIAENRNGASALRPYDPATGELGDPLELGEPGVAAPLLSADGSTAVFTLTTARLAAEIDLAPLPAGPVRRLTGSGSGSAGEIDPEALVTPSLATVESFDGETIPLFVYAPPASAAPPSLIGRPPVVVVVHGGPESQATRSFSPVIQGLAAAGIGVVVPNVRGSTGYGRRYASLDDTTRRLDSVRDLEAVHDGLAELGFDPGRAALWGGSYGGYMVLAGLAFQPQRWAAGVDIVGISNLVTFLRNTSDYRRAHRELEYGSLQRDRAFLAEASPLTHLDAMRAPLFVIHGRNDPRVPVTEAEQLAAGLTERGVRCELVIYDDEGHGLARLPNRLDAYPRAVAFLADVLEVRRPG